MIETQAARRPARRAGLVGAFALGAIAATGQAPLGLWWLALPGYAGITLLVATAYGIRWAAVLGWMAGAGHFGIALSWIVEPFLIDAPRHGWMAPFALLLMAFGLGLFWAAAAAVTARLHGVPARALGFAAVLTAAEALRGMVLTGFPWAQPGHIWIDTPVVQSAAIVGPEGLTVLVLLPVALVIAFRGAGFGGAAILLAAVWGWGEAQLATPMPERADAPVLRLVQPNAEQAAKWDPDLARGHFDTLLDLTRSPPDRPVPDLVIWPETSVPYLLDRAPGVVWDIATAGGGAPVAVGIQRSDGGPRFWNSLAVVAPGGVVTAVYDKHHLVPFGEYIPFGDQMARWFGLRAFASQEGFGYSAGPGPALIDLGGTLGRVLPLICYEAVFPQDVRAAPARPDWLLHVTNDAWFGTLSGPYQHLAQSRLRAVEQGLPLVRVANTGVSALIDAKGRVLASLPLGVAGTLDVPLPAALPATGYARLGQGQVWALLVLLWGAALWLSRRSRHLVGD